MTTSNVSTSCAFREPASRPLHWSGPSWLADRCKSRSTVPSPLQEYCEAEAPKVASWAATSTAPPPNKSDLPGPASPQGTQQGPAPVLGNENPGTGGESGLDLAWAANGYRPSARLAVGQDTISNSDSVKLLGYTINSAPGASGQVEAILNKFRVRYWSLIHLRRAGIKGGRLFRLYAALVRPVIEANNVIYHSMLTRTQTKAIEKLQRHVVGLCYGHQVRYAEALIMNNQDTLENRRIKACKKLVSKTLQQGGRFAEKWFRRRNALNTDIRRRRPFEETRAKTERYYKSPLLYFQRLANDCMT